MKYKVIFLDPLNPKPIEWPELDAEGAFALLDNTPWEEHLKAMKSVKPREVHWSPTVEFHHPLNKTKYMLSAADGQSWVLGIVQAGTVKRFPWSKPKLEEEVYSDVELSSMELAKHCLQAWLAEDFEYLNRILKL